MDLNKKNTVLVTCGPGLVDFLEGELKELGFAAESRHDGGIGISANGRDVMKLNLHLRTAYNVLYLLSEFECTNPKDLYKHITAMEWEKMIANDEYLSVVARVDTPTIDNTMFAGMKVKDAIVDRITMMTGERPNSGPSRDNLVYHLYWKKDRCWLYLNTSGNKLSDRGYRKMPHYAPLRESLAAGILIAAEYDGTKPIVLPMCGSGTLAIEAALIAQGRPCGLLRSNYGFMHEKTFDEEAWQEMRKDALKIGKKKKDSPCAIIATDIDRNAITASMKNAQTAGVDHLIEFDVCDFADTKMPDGPGIVLMNPEYGERLGDTKELEGTYNRMGDFFKQSCQGYNAFIFTGNLQLAKRVGLRTSKRTIFYNGNIECRLLKYEMYAGTRRKSE